MYSKIYNINGEFMVAACSKELIGKTFREDGVVLELKESFYKGTLTTEEELVELLNKATIANLAGKAVDIALKNNFINKEGIIEISGVKHAQIVLI